jgi:intracellular sulfur oxidation DsrE/DsrF family protein
MEKDQLNPSPRRKFLGSLAAGAAAIGLFSFKAPLDLQQATLATNVTGSPDPKDAEAWFNTVKGKHRIVYDVPRPNELMPFAWPRVFLITNGVMAGPSNECGVVVILRHDAIGYALEDGLWAKYNLGEVFKADDPLTKKRALRNPFWKPKEGDYKIPGIGNVKIGINELQADGVMFCVCDAALTVFSAALADGVKTTGADIKKEWLKGLLPGIQVVPSGVWAVGRAQEHNCAYCYAG